MSTIIIPGRISPEAQAFTANSENDPVFRAPRIRSVFRLQGADRVIGPRDGFKYNPRLKAAKQWQKISFLYANKLGSRTA